MANSLKPTIGTSKEYSILHRYLDEHSRYSTQTGNALLGDAIVYGGYTAENTYAEKFIGGDGTFGAGRSIPRQEMEVFTNSGNHEIGEKPWRESAVSSN